MSKYISADKAIDALDKHCEVVCQYSKKQRAVMCGACPLGGAFDVIDDLPAADVQEVVRCKDCKHNPMHSFTGCPMAGIEKRKMTDYCSFGEREDG